MIHVLVIDDSITARQVLSRELARYDDIRVVGTAADAYEARRLIVLHNPDVITLDLEMPRMNGTAFLEKLMQHFPLPVVVVSSLTPENSEPALRALQLGAIEVVHKARLGSHTAAGDRLVQAIRTAAIARVPRRTEMLRAAGETPATTMHGVACDVIALGASTGGTRAIETLLRVLPADMPPMVIAQHLPASFTQSFARRLDGATDLEVRPAAHGAPLLPGSVYVGPGDHHVGITRDGDVLSIVLTPISGVRFDAPSADVLFRSVAEVCGERAIGVLLTGMGVDGAHGLLELRRRGAFTIAESEETCVVFGMPRAAIELGAAVAITPLHGIADLLHSRVQAKPGTARRPAVQVSGAACRS